MKYVGIVTDRLVSKSHKSLYNPIWNGKDNYFTVRESQKRRIYSDEVPVADEEDIARIKFRRKPFVKESMAKFITGE